jgi:hypothetical protein
MRDFLIDDYFKTVGKKGHFFVVLTWVLAQTLALTILINLF